ncbi:MAG TPA: hypothetical protein VM598_11595, partial [Bdellovibrionota bacterium]|nr:hypothetical protein [Bdellovibrionota bacterium]
NARYKKGLYQLSNDLSFLNNIGPIGIVIDLVVSQMTAGMVERLEYHEHQLMGLLEAAERFELSGDEFPAPLLTPTLDVLYASTVFLEKDSVERPHYLTSRIQSQISQEKAKTAILAKLEAELPEGDEVTVFGGGKYALVRGQDGRMKSVMSSAIKPHWLFRYVAKHVDGKSMNGKWWERELVTLASFLARALLPESIAFRIGSVPVGITVQPTVYEQIFRLPMTREKYLEGELIGLVDEALAGRLKLPLSQAELEYVRAGLWKSLINPYENLPGTEDGIIQANYEYVESILGR